MAPNGTIEWPAVSFEEESQKSRWPCAFALPGAAAKLLTVQRGKDDEVSGGTAFVTGAATGIGKGLVEKLDREGWRVFAGYNRTPPDALVAACGPSLTIVHCDVSDQGSAAEAAHRIAEALGGAPLDLLVNNAATTKGAGGAMENVDLMAFHHLFEVNFWGALRVTQALLPSVRKSRAPRIVMVGSPSQYLTIPLGAQYPISKIAMAKMTEALRIELKPFGIQVTSLEPNGVETPMTSFTEEERRDMWATFPEHLLSAYQKHFKYPGDVLSASFKLWSPEKFADVVYDKVITAKKMKPRYVIGPNAWILPTLNRWASKGAQERLFEKMFRIR
jgi:NAD(P)-dependent dehydrogenase (short-subunit alcohol dehydrogenase family)